MAAKTHALFDLLYRQLGRKILGLLLKRNGGDLAAAEAVVQDTFIAAYKSFHTFNNKSSYFTWLCRIALNKMADYYRDQANKKSKTIVPTLHGLSQILSPEISLEEQLMLEDLKTKVNNCLDLLPSEYRKLLQLKYYADLSNQQICLKLDLTERKLEGKLYRAKKALAKAYERSNSSN